MLQFIVLGIIPGTSVQLSFTSTLLGAAVVSGTAYLWRVHARQQKRKIEQLAISLIAL